MTPNKLPPLPEPEFIRPDRPFKIFTADQMLAYGKLCSAEAFQLYVDANEARIDAEKALRQSQSLPAGAVAGLSAQLRQMACWCKSSEDDNGTGTFIPAYSSGDVFDLLTQAALQADAREKGEAVVFGLRRKGETAIIGVIPHKVHAVKATSEEFLSGYEEVPLYARPEQAATGDEAMAMHWIDRYAAGIDEEPQMDRIREALATQPAQASEKDNG